MRTSTLSSRLTQLDRHQVGWISRTITSTPWVSTLMRDIICSTKNSIPEMIYNLGLSNMGNKCENEVMTELGVDYLERNTEQKKRSSETSCPGKHGT